MPADESGTRERDLSLADLWRRSAERATDGLLACLAAAGALAAAAACALALDVIPGALRSWWPLLLPAIGAGGFGLWGIAAREEAERRAAGASPAAVAAFAALRWLAALAAALALGVALVLVLALALGTWMT